MNPDLFSYYLIDTSKLREIGYQDLENLIVRFPYCQNLHFLVAKKSHIEDHPDFERWLNKAATYSTDRSYLYQLLHEVDFQKDYIFEGEKFDLGEIAPKQETPEPVVLEAENEKELVFLEVEKRDADFENIIEATIPAAAIIVAETPQVVDNQYVEDEEEYEKPLMTLSDLMKQNEENEIATTDSEEELMTFSDLMKQNEENEITTTDSKEEELMTFSDLMKEDENDYKIEIPEEDEEHLMTFEELMQLNAAEEKTEAEIVPTENKKELEDIAQLDKKPLKPMPKTAFSSWQKKAKSTNDEVGGTTYQASELAQVTEKIGKRMGGDDDKKKKKGEKKKNKQGAMSFVDKSLIPDASIATETLAKILALQGRKEEAILMFEKLKLQMPEKSTFFAAEIEKLK